MNVVTGTPATEDELRLFHSAYYSNYLNDNFNDEILNQYTDAGPFDCQFSMSPSV